MHFESEQVHFRDAIGLEMEPSKDAAFEDVAAFIVTK